MRQKYIFKGSHSLTGDEYRFKGLIWIFFPLYVSCFCFQKLAANPRVYMEMPGGSQSIPVLQTPLTGFYWFSSVFHIPS